MLEQLEAHQRALLADVLPPPRKAVPAGQPKVVKPIWEMGEDDFEGVDDEDHSEGALFFPCGGGARARGS